MRAISQQSSSSMPAGFASHFWASGGVFGFQRIQSIEVVLCHSWVTFLHFYGYLNPIRNKHVHVLSYPNHELVLRGGHSGVRLLISWASRLVGLLGFCFAMQEFQSSVSRYRPRNT